MTCFSSLAFLMTKMMMSFCVFYSQKSVRHVLAFGSSKKFFYLTKILGKDIENSERRSFSRERNKSAAQFFKKECKVRAVRKNWRSRALFWLAFVWETFFESAFFLYFSHFLRLFHIFWIFLIAFKAKQSQKYPRIEKSAEKSATLLLESASAFTILKLCDMIFQGQVRNQLYYSERVTYSYC